MQYGERSGTVALTDPTSITAEMTVQDMVTDSLLRCSSYRFKRRSEALEDQLRATSVAQRNSAVSGTHRACADARSPRWD